MAAKILVVDDDPDLRRMVAFALRGRGYEVTECGEGEDALDLARDGHFDIALLDVLMPRMNGFELCRRLAEVAGDPRLPTIMLTCLDHIEQKLLGFEAGADDYVCKPFSTEELVARIEAVLRRARTAPETTGQTRGRLSDLSLADLMQIMADGRKNGMIELAHEGAAGTLCIRDGRPIAARAGEVAGEEGIHLMLTWHTGEFVFHPGDPQVEENVSPTVSIQGIILEAARRLDESIRDARVERRRAAQPVTAAPFAEREAPSDEPAEDTTAAAAPLRRLAEAHAGATGAPPDAEKTLRMVIAGPTAAGREEFFSAFQRLLAPYRDGGPPSLARSAGPLPWDRALVEDGLVLHFYGVGTEPGQSYLWGIALENVDGCILLVDPAHPARMEQSKAFYQVASRNPATVFAAVAGCDAPQPEPDLNGVRQLLGLPEVVPLLTGPPASTETAGQALEAWVDRLLAARSIPAG